MVWEKLLSRHLVSVKDEHSWSNLKWILWHPDMKPTCSCCLCAKGCCFLVDEWGTKCKLHIKTHVIALHVSGEGRLCVLGQLASRWELIGWDSFWKMPDRLVFHCNWSQDFTLLKLFRLLSFSPQIQFLKMHFPHHRTPMTPIAVLRCSHGWVCGTTQLLCQADCAGAELSFSFLHLFLHCQSSVLPSRQ